MRPGLLRDRAGERGHVGGLAIPGDRERVLLETGTAILVAGICERRLMVEVCTVVRRAVAGRVGDGEGCLEVARRFSPRRHADGALAGTACVVRTVRASATDPRRSDGA